MKRLLYIVLSMLPLSIFAQGKVQQTFDCGSEITLTATAEAHQHFVRWSDGNTDNPREVTIKDNMTFIAEFAIDRFSITAVSANESMGVVTGGGEYDYGTEISLTATPKVGYTIKQWQDGSKDNPHKVTVTKDETFTAQFEEVKPNVFTVKFFDWDGKILKTEQVEEGKDATAPTDPKREGWTFIGWDKDFKNITSNLTVTAQYDINTYKVTLVSEHGNIIIVGTQIDLNNVEYQTTLHLIAVADDNYKFVKWSNGSTETSTTITIISDLTITAYFELLPEPEKEYVINVLSANEDMGTVLGGGIFKEGETIVMYAQAKDGYKFVQWSDGNIDNPRTVIVSGDATYTAEFEAITIAQYTLTLVAQPEEGGTLVGAGNYEANSTVTFLAQPNEHFTFQTWSDGNATNPRTVKMTQNMVFTAIFVADKYNIIVSSNDATMGRVSGTGKYNYGTEVEIKASPFEGFEFMSWDDNDTNNPRKIVVEGDMTYTAIFHEIGAGVEAINSQQSSLRPHKTIIDGHIYIETPDGKRYDIVGKEVR